VEKTALIVTDGAETTQKMAETIAEALKDYKVNLVAAKDFSGTHILSADICFFGAETPNPPSFAYLYKVLEHINLAGRLCGIFSSSEKTVEYLCGMVHDSELILYPDPFLGKGDVKSWVDKVLISKPEKQSS
jgi:flavodoxin